MAERKRYYFSFDMDNPRHREAEALISGQSIHMRSEFVVTSILAAYQTECLEQTVRQAVRDELKKLRLLSQHTQPEEADMAVQLTELPGCLLHALEEL